MANVILLQEFKESLVLIKTMINTSDSAVRKDLIDLYNLTLEVAKGLESFQKNNELNQEQFEYFFAYLSTLKIILKNPTEYF